ncbi:Imm7 family immunity protein [Paenibacillus solani]|uniref:Imm7 family immunity protein n=1 Tax=Paenibacillus solani TaxID=1705565 RepID=UPI001A94B3BA
MHLQTPRPPLKTVWCLANNNEVGGFQRGRLNLKFTKYIAEIGNMKLSMLKRYNGQDSFLISGLHNHKSEYVINIFKWIAINLPGSYGLLYIHDDEDIIPLCTNCRR